MRELQPRGSRLLLKRLEPEKTTKSGLYLPDTAKEKPKMGTVVAAGPKVYHDFLEGDVVVFGAYVGDEVRFEDQEFVIVKAKDVLAVVHETALVKASFEPRYASEEEREASIRAIAKANSEALSMIGAR